MAVKNLDKQRFFFEGIAKKFELDLGKERFSVFGKKLLKPLYELYDEKSGLFLELGFAEGDYVVEGKIEKSMRIDGKKVKSKKKQRERIKQVLENEKSLYNTICSFYHFPQPCESYESCELKNRDSNLRYRFDHDVEEECNDRITFTFVNKTGEEREFIYRLERILGR